MFSGFGQVIGAGAVALSLAGPVAAASVADQYSSYWALGDSLSDDGNLPGLVYDFATQGVSSTQTGTNAYYRGRFSNGPTWAEYLEDEFAAAGKPNDNLAIGGSEAAEPQSLLDPTPGLEYQKNRLVDDHAGQFGASPLVSILSGANDLLQGVASANPAAIAVAAADAVTDTARFLAGHGVRDFVIGNIPDLGKVPRFAMLAPGDVQAAHDSTVAFNTRLSANIGDMRAGGLNVTVLDLWGILTDMRAAPQNYGLTDTTRPCLYPTADAAALFGEAQQCSNDQALTRLFFDPVHPSAVVHQTAGEQIIAALTIAPVPLPGGLVLLWGGLAGFGLLRRRPS
ncbi:SGNH/GDSL hydrolase family protein [Paracoccus sp. (in: a-proteobacteria)]|uniref:SGNH/GDSL hydrolase family protein n=1 Tax=Paracoccus sp. TaxID=267 RepID=UPI003A8BB844